MSGTWSSLLGLAWATLAVPCPEAESEAPALERGVALGLFSADPTYDYGDLILEIAELGATHVSLVWVWWQDDVRATSIAAEPGSSATAHQIVQTMKQAKAADLHVTGFPIVRLRHGERTEWRGKIDPANEDAWWRSYEAFILEGALWAKRGGADRYSVGSELLSRERMRARWLALIDRVRLRAERLELLYSANWDHYRPVTFWDAVDVVGVTGYWELTDDPDASTSELVAAWSGPKAELTRWSNALGRPVVLTEIGYPSLDGAARWPWDETRQAPIDLEEQARAYRAFTRAWDGERSLAGVYFWNWFGFGGAEDGNYTPRNKPAAEVLRAWFRGSSGSQCPPSSLRP